MQSKMEAKGQSLRSTISAASDTAGAEHAQ